MEFSEEDKNLVYIVDTAGKTAQAFHEGRITRKEKDYELGEFIKFLVRGYVKKYLIEHHKLPSNSLFGEAINWYVDRNFSPEDNGLAKTVKNMMRELVIPPLERYRGRAREYGSQIQTVRRAG